MTSDDISPNAARAQARVMDRVLGVTVWTRGDVRAPHKPLLLLLALGRVMNELPRLTPFSEVEPVLKNLLIEFGPYRTSYHPEYPFWRLQNDGFWELTNTEFVAPRKGNTDAKKTELLKYNVRGGFDVSLYEVLDSDKAFCRRLAQQIADENFPSSITEDVLDAVGITPYAGSPDGSRRDSKFRGRVLNAYEYRCAVCGFDVLIGNSSIGLEAAHIKWKQAKGPDEECNGIALCCLHHKLFDRGAFTLDKANSLLVSEKARGTTGFIESLMEYHGRPIADPIRNEYSPAWEYVDWHQREVFHRPGRVID